MPFAPLAFGFSLVLAVGAWIYRLRRNAGGLPAEPQAQPHSSLPPDTEKDHSAEPSEAAPSLQQTALGTPLASARAHDPEPRAESAAAPAGASMTTAILAPGFEADGDTVEQQFGFFNPESNANTTHVVLSSALNEPPPFVERRKSPADVLLQAIKREPHRSDLRLKLVELYYTAAAENRRAFLEATRQLAKNEKLASAEEWSRIADMGRAIAPEDELFSDSMDDKAVA
jgi:hypothetical protein